jgi:nucleotide-binding universal stress UspA family protein
MSLKIVCAIDDQEHSWRVASAAIDLTKRLSAELIFCMINPAIPPGRGVAYWWPEAYIEKVLEQAVRRARLSGVWEVRTYTKPAIYISDGIIACAVLYQADYIVLGTRGRSEIVRLVSGSVSREVSSKVNCPVILVRSLESRPPQWISGGLAAILRLLSWYKKR